MSTKQRLYPTASQRAVLRGHVEVARITWNLAFEQLDFYSRGSACGRTPRYNEQARQLTALRAADPAWAAGSIVVQQQELRVWDRAVRDWVLGQRGRPQPRRTAPHGGFSLGRIALYVVGSVRWAVVTIPNAGRVRLRLTHPIEHLHEGLAARVTLDRAGRWWITIQLPQPTFEREPTGSSVGIDLGTQVTIATSTGELLSAPRLTDPERRRLATLTARLSRQQSGSARHEQTRLAIARLRARETDRRRDWIEQTTTQLVREHDLIAVEALRPESMSRRPRPVPSVDRPGGFEPSGAVYRTAVNRAIRDAAWGAIVRRIEDKAAAATSPVTVIRVDPRQTSQTCAACGHVDPTSRVSRARFICTKCGLQAHADSNAACVVLARATQTPEHVSGSGHVGRDWTCQPAEAAASTTHRAATDIIIGSLPKEAR